MIGIEKQGITARELKVLTPTKIQIGDVFYDVHDIGDPEEQSPGVHVGAIAFDDPQIAARMDAARITVDAGYYKKPEHLTGPRVFIEKVTKGSATWLGITPEGETISCTFDADSEQDNGVIIWGEGWTGCWIPGPQGVEFIEICIPPFEEDNAVVWPKPGDEEVAGKSIPTLFWKLFYLFTKPTEKLD